MFKFLKSKSNERPKPDSKSSWTARLKQGMKRTRQKFSKNLSSLLFGKKKIDLDLFEELETLLITSDVGVEVSKRILSSLTERVKRNHLSDPSKLLSHLKDLLVEIVAPCEVPLEITKAPFTLLVVGVNGVGKTTSIAKLAHYFQRYHSLKILLAAGDTFRAGAIEQLQIWGDRNNVPVIAQQAGSDSASVLFDSMQAAKSKKVDLLIADTAGRLHSQEHLMAELQKIKRVIQKQDKEAPQETMLIIDAGMGQNALRQAELFQEAIGLTGITITKLDGTARGGMVFAIAEKLKLPIRFLGVGEEVEDLKPFVAQEFVDAFLELPEKNE